MLKNPEEFRALLKIVRHQRQLPGAVCVKVSGSILDNKPPEKRGDLDILIVSESACGISFSHRLEAGANLHIIETDIDHLGNDDAIWDMYQKGRVVFERDSEKLG